WPVAHWAAFYQLAAEAGWHLAFTTARGAREQSLMDELKRAAPHAPILPVITDLALFLAVLRRAEAFISGDTGPLHFAAGLGVPTIGLFGPSPADKWAPLGQAHRALQADRCACGVDTSVCLSASPCMAAISPEAVLRLVL